MNKVWIRTVPVDGEPNKQLVTNIHYKPFHSKYGLSPEDLAAGVIVDGLPPKDIRLGYIAQLFYSSATESLWYEYEEDPNAVTETVKSRLDATEADNLMALEAIATLYEMLTAGGELQ